MFSPASASKANAEFKATKGHELELTFEKYRLSYIELNISLSPPKNYLPSVLEAERNGLYFPE
jgi:hypothetical protein